MQTGAKRAKKKTHAAKRAGKPMVKLLPGENPDIRAEFRLLLSNADEWMATPNTILMGKAPNDLVGTPDEQKLRDIVRGVRYSSMT